MSGWENLIVMAVRRGNSIVGESLEVDLRDGRTMELTEYLNVLGSEGWEPYAVSNTSSDSGGEHHLRIYMKRPRSEQETS